MWNPFNKVAQKAAVEVSGISVLFLQRKLQSFSDEELTKAMERAWGKEHDKTSFYGMSTFDGEGGLLKMNDMFFTMQHIDRRVDAAALEDRELPLWAAHSAHTKFGYKCPEGVPAGKVRDQLGWLIGRYCVELLGDNTVGLLFVEAGVLVPFNADFDETLRKQIGENPEQLF